MKLFNPDSAVIKATNEFCDRFFTEESISQWVDSQGLPSDVYDAFYNGALGAYCRPSNFGGLDCDFIERISMVAQLMRRSGATLPFLSDMLTFALLSTMRPLSQQEIVLDLARRSGRVSFSQAFSEANAGSDASGVITSVSVDEGGAFLDGRKSFVSNGQFASDTLVLARDPVFGGEDGGLSLWLVPLRAPGVSAYPINSVGQEMLAPALIEFDHVALDPTWRIQTEGRLDSMLKRQYELGRIAICASALGLARAAMDDVLGYASAHMVKGRCLGSIPQVQEKLADMETRLRAMESLVADAASSVYGNDAEMHLSCALMKRSVPRMATEVASEAMQVFGGRGYTDETRIGRIWRDCRGNMIAQGPDEIMAHIAAKYLLEQNAE